MRAVLLTGSDQPTDGEKLFQGRLRRLGFSTIDTLIVKQGFVAADVRNAVLGAALVLISSILDTTTGIGPTLRDLPVPMFSNEWALADDLGMIPMGLGRSGVEDGIGVRIIEPTSAQAAGLTGEVIVLSAPRPMAWVQPVPASVNIGSMTGNPAHMAIFSFDKGAALYTGAAPARRVGFFANDRAVTALNDNGWKLFDASVRWAAGLPP